MTQCKEAFHEARRLLVKARGNMESTEGIALITHVALAQTLEKNREHTMAAYEELVDVRRKMGLLHNKEGLHLLKLFSRIMSEHADFTGAIKLLEEARVVAQEMGTLELASEGLNLLKNLGMLKELNSDLEGAEEAYVAALATKSEGDKETMLTKEGKKVLGRK